MNFVTFQFVVFLVITVIVFMMMSPYYRKYFILLCSYFFYGTWSVPLISVILFSTSVDYYLGKKIHKSHSQTHKKLYLTLSILVNCSILVYFKYMNFFISSIDAVGFSLGATQLLLNPMHIILPLGVSFYTFEAISYIVDIYRGEKPASSWLNYNFYIMYFPHLISGPIVRYKELHAQYESKIELPETSRLKEGFQLLLYGFIFKLIIADSMASISDPLFDKYQTIGHLESWLASIAFTIQIYFDFLGYTHIARGVSLFFNIKLPVNFNHPYNARNISEFWQRWHITLSLWIRDYLYIPLGGNRGRLYQTVNNLLITMFIAGLWHGASWNYAIWGIYHGCLLAVYHVFRFYYIKRNLQTENQLMKIGSIIMTYSLVVIGWVIFRSTSFEQAFTILGKMYDIPGFVQEFAMNQRASAYTDSLFYLVGMFALCFIGPTFKSIEKKILSAIQPFWIKKWLYSLSIFTVLIFMFSPVKPFIYFVF
ncbi:TPA: MBOAT family O-acyltransferase [Legionella pneumophila]|nr:MBOAT family protein [Legionella pneumophila]HAU0882912.1 MBOAT family protein [Legionella pneumophila]HCD9577666.1 MBOAT family protein [Legionella pneumophila]HDO7949336.1 MBOAT family protein [Legionella pneumophila]HDO7950803.1 MBOAT family protein [Legionella pneumophila]